MQNLSLIEDAKLTRPIFSVRSRFVIGIALCVGFACASGCSGLLTDGGTGNLLSDRPVPSSKQLPSMTVDAETSLDELTKLAADESQVVFNPDPEAKPSPEAQDLISPGFRFSAQLPEEPDFGDDFVSSKLPAAKSEEITESAPTPETVPTNITLVASTQPIAPTKASSNVTDARPIDLEVLAASIPSQPIEKLIVNPLKPLTNATPILKSNSSNTFEVAAGLPQLSTADLQRVSRSAVEAPSMSSHEMVDLSALELESNLTEVPSVAEPVPPPKTLSATEHLSETIRLLEESTRELSASGEHQGAEIGVGLLKVLRQKVDAMSSHPWHLSTEEHKYWEQQLDAVSVMLKSNASGTSDETDHARHHSAAQAIKHLDQAADHLRSMVGLHLQGGQLCSQILGFGQFRELESNQFQLGDRALVYVEVENQSSQRTSDEQSPESKNISAWKTRLRSSYVILDSDGNVAQEETFPVIEDVAQRRRRDFYLHLPLTISDLPPGSYQLSLSVQDLGNESLATLPAVHFSVVDDAK